MKSASLGFCPSCVEPIAANWLGVCCLPMQLLVKEQFGAVCVSAREGLLAIGAAWYDA
jgi:hypothetical protein